MEEQQQLQTFLQLLNQNAINFKADTSEQVGEKVLIKVNRIVNHFISIYPQANINCKNIEQETYQIILPLEIHGGMCKTNIFIKVDFASQKLIICIQFGEVQQKSLKNQITRYLLRLNNKLISFYMNWKFGYVGLRFDCYLMQEETFGDHFFLFLDSLIYTALHSMKFNFMRILFLMNRIKIKDFPSYEEYMEKQKRIILWRKLPKQGKELLGRVKLTVKNNMHIPFTAQKYKIYGSILAKSRIQDSKCLVEIQITKRGFEKYMDGWSFNYIYSEDLYYTIVGCEIQTEINDEICFNIYSQHTCYPMIEPELQPSSYEEILYNINYEYLYYRAFGPEIYGDKESIENLLYRTVGTLHPKNILVIKNQKDQNVGKIEIERQILLTLSANKNQINSEGDKYIDKNGCCPYIAQYYYDNNEKGTLIMEYYCNSSLNNFKKDGIKLSTKIQIALCIAMGLRYCHSYGIVHMDIKPANILLDSQLMAKIAGFDEAIPENKKGRSLPVQTRYVAPELIKGQTITTAYDIFSFGTLLFELIFDYYPLDQKSNKKNLVENFLKNNYHVSLHQEYAQAMGPQVILKCLGSMCIKCLHSEPSMRPNIDKICLVLKDCLTYFDKVY